MTNKKETKEVKEAKEDKPVIQKSTNASNDSATAGVCAGVNNEATARSDNGVPPQAGESRPKRDEAASIARELQKEIDQLRQLARERDEFLATLQRVQADFANYQKRIKQEKICWEEFKDEDILKALLPAFDNLERTLQVKCDSKDAVCLQEGIDLTKNEIFRILEKRRVSRIKTSGEKFNPAFHEAVGIRETGQSEPGLIVEEIRAGYFLQDRVLRPAQVIISAPTRPPARQEKPTVDDSGN